MSHLTLRLSDGFPPKEHLRSEVKELQRLLARAGYSVAADGLFGEGTEKVVKKFQLARGLPADGIVGPATWKALSSSKPVASPPPPPSGGSRGRVDYTPGVVVSSSTLRKKLRSIAKFFNWHITVHHGNRVQSVQGGSSTSLHLSGRAADFHIKNVSDQAAFRKLVFHRRKLIPREYELIWHGTGTHTGGPHLHMGHQAGQASEYLEEGTLASPGGKYSPTRLRN
jgi:hypothetical protein